MSPVVDRLPVSLSNEFFYLTLRDGGLQIPNLYEIVGIAKIKIHKSIKLSNDTVLKLLIESQNAYIQERYLQALGLGGIQPSTDINEHKLTIKRERRVAFRRKIHGVGHEIFSSCPMTNKWLNGTFKGMNARTYIRGIKLRTNSLETKVTCTRGMEVNKTCRLCNNAEESLMHILQICECTRGTRYTRHHKLRYAVAQKLRHKGYEVYEEQTYYPNENNLKCCRPDIIAIKNNKAYILDVTYVYEISGASFIRAYQDRKQRYEPIETAVMSRYNCKEIQTHGLTVGSRGSFFYGHLNIWRQLGFTNGELTTIAINGLQDSIKICSILRKTKDIKNSIK